MRGLKPRPATADPSRRRFGGGAVGGFLACSSLVAGCQYCAVCVGKGLVVDLFAVDACVLLNCDQGPRQQHTTCSTRTHRLTPAPPHPNTPTPTQTTHSGSQRQTPTMADPPQPQASPRAPTHDDDGGGSTGGSHPPPPPPPPAAPAPTATATTSTGGGASGGAARLTLSPRKSQNDDWSTGGWFSINAID